MKYYVIILILGLGVFTSHAGTSTVEAEIQHLIDYVRNAPVEFIRNGKTHTAAQAAEHMAKKAKHYRDQINTAEDFIRLAATKSVLSGELYSIRTSDGKLVMTGEWLTQELERFRNARNETPGRRLQRDAPSRAPPRFVVGLDRNQYERRNRDSRSMHPFIFLSQFFRDAHYKSLENRRA